MNWKAKMGGSLELRHFGEFQTISDPDSIKRWRVPKQTHLLAYTHTHTYEHMCTQNNAQMQIKKQIVMGVMFCFSSPLKDGNSELA